jgi:hypothetical protein
MYLKLLIENRDTHIKTFLFKTTKQPISVIITVVDEIKKSNKILYGVIISGTNKEATIMDPNANNKWITFQFRNATNAERCLPSCFWSNGNNPPEFTSIEWNPENSEFSSFIEAFFFEDVDKLYGVNYPIVNRHTANEFFRNFFEENEVTQEVFNEFFLEDETIEYGRLMEKNGCSDAASDFINGQMEWLEGLIISNKLGYKKEYSEKTGGMREFLSDFIIDNKKETARQINYGSGTDNYDFGPWTKED